MIRRSKRHLLFAIAVLALLSTAVPAAAQELDTARLDKALETVRKWTYGQDAGDLQYVGGVVVQAGNTPAMRKGVERRLIAAMKGDGTKEGKAFLCRQLVIVGTSESIPALAGMLGDKDLSHMARYALERIEGAAACDAMRAALPKVDDKLKIGLMHSLGRRGDEKAVDELVKCAGAANQDVAAAALTGLGLISSDKATAAVAKARAGAADKKLKQIATQAYLRCAQGLLARRQKDKAAAIYRELLGPSETAMTRIASLRSLAAVLGGNGLAMVIQALDDKDARVRQAAIPCLRDVPGAEATKAIADMIPRQKPPVQKLLILVLTDRGDASALPAVVRAMKAEDESVRVAAIEALGRLGDASVASALAERAAGGGKEQPVARVSLQQLKGKGVNAALIAQLGKADAKVRVEVIRALGARGAGESIGALLKQTGDDDPAVRAEVSRVLRSLAGPEHMPALVQLLVGAKPGREREETERSVVAIAKQIPPEKGPGKAVLAAMAKTQGETRCSLIRVLGKIGDDATLEAVTAGLSDGDAKVCDASLRALAGWPTAAPAATLKRLITDAKTSTQRLLALRGYIEMISLRTDIEDEQQLVAAYAAAMAMAQRPQEKSLVLSKLSGVRHGSAIDLARKSMDDPKLKSAAAAAIQGIEKALKQPPRSFASTGANEVRLATDGNKTTRWTTGTPMRGGEWFVLSLGQTRRVTGLIVDATPSNGDYPRGYEIYVSLSRSTWGPAVAKGKATRPRLDVSFPPKMGRYVKIVQTGRAEGNFWSIHHIEAKGKSK